MPHHPPKHHLKPRKAKGTPRGGLPASRILGFVDEVQLDGWLAPLVPDAADRAFVLRCLVGEGPIHHRGANYILLALLGRAVQAHGGLPPLQVGEAVPMRLPPHLVAGMADSAYPVQLPVRALRELAGGDNEGAGERLDAMVDCLTDGPPQHALANVVMVALLEGLLPAAPAVAPTAGEQT